MLRMLVVSICVVMFAGCALIPGNTPSWFPAPDKPKGPAESFVGDVVQFKTEGHDPIDVHEFQWDMGDGTVTDWDDDDEKVKHVYTATGTYKVKVQEQCPLKLFRSQWSDERSINVLEKPGPKFRWLFLD